MRELLKATMQFVCEIGIYTFERILEHLESDRPNIDDPLPAGYTAGPIDDFSGYSFTEEISHDRGATWHPRLPR